MGNSSPRRTQLYGILIVLLASALFSSLGVLTNFAYEAGMSPVAFGAWRETLGAITMVILLLCGVGRPQAGERNPFKNMPKSQIRNLCFAAFAFMTYSLAIFYAFVYLTVSLAFLLFYIYPAIVTIISAVTGREMLTRTKLIALICALSGSTLAIIGQMFGEELRINWFGIVLALLAAVGIGVYFLIGKSGYPKLPASYATTIFLIAGAIVFSVIGFLFGEGESMLHPFKDASVWPILIFAGVIAAAIPTMLLLTGIRMIGPSKASIMAIFEPIVGSVLAAVFLHQQLYLIQIIGGVLILGAAYMLQRDPNPLNEHPNQPPIHSSNISS
ncbi:DMT family transporter [Paenibacillus sp. N1-5-1-14]|uniref:DMT family transporter n=1 Tax=Paenibacillus radicibacter TaxID=2972488 RepID=UPI0021593E51|nr:DMT family transporter [Paenibacillus radicibacter]MCR8644496.1 DMT family transporter [Paenibacillus radicibacter]